MTTTDMQRQSLQNQLKTKHICRFCLSQQTKKLGNIYMRDQRIKSSAPLTVQIMACASMEVFSNDGMPQSVCFDCRVLFEHCYRFKQMCKKAETLLRQVPLTGEWPKEIQKPKLPTSFLAKVDKPLLQHTYEEDVHPPKSAVKKVSVPQKDVTATVGIKRPRSKEVLNGKNKTTVEAKLPPVAKKILNANPAKSPEPPVPKRTKREEVEEEDDHDFDEDAATIFLNKVENDEELSMEDLHRLIQSNTLEDITDKIKEEPSPKPKLLNKSSIRILNKEADKVIEPQFSKPEVKRDKDGNVAIVTEIINPSEFNLENQNIKDAQPVETNVFPCQHCERSFPLRQLRDIHIVNHTRERSNPCPNCNKSFFSKYDLQKHLLTHSGDKPFKCSICEKAFTRATLLHRHEKTHTDIPKFICCYCEKPFISHEEMEKHAERHNKNRPFKCSICNKSFAFKQGLERHFVVHSNDQPFPCHYCSQSFPTSSKLARHLTAHAGQRPYPCKFCPKSFLLSHHLTRHLRSHKSSVINYECSSCNAVFTAREDLIRHSGEHSKENLICVLCCEKISDVDKVNEHVEAHVINESYACEFCDMIFMSAERLQEHTNNDHADDLVAYIEDDKKQLKNIEEKHTLKAVSTKTTSLSVKRLHENSNNTDNENDGGIQSEDDKSPIKKIEHKKPITKVVSAKVYSTRKRAIKK